MKTRLSTPENRLRILVLTKRQYMNRDLIDDEYGRFREIPLELSRRGHLVRGICLSYKEREESTFHDEAVKWESINAGSLVVRGLLRFVDRAACLSQDADVIWACSDSVYGIIGYFLGRKYGVPVVFDLYDNFEYYLAARLPIMKQLYRMTLRRCSAVTCVSEPLAHLVQSHGCTGGVYVLENAVRSDLFRPLIKEECRRRLGLPIDCRIVGTAGALEKNRGIQYLFDAFAQLKDMHPDLHLALAGPRSPGVRVPRGTKVHDLGILAHEDVPVFYNALDVAAICNLDNTFGRYCFPQKAREIMACKVPLISSKVGSMDQLFKNHKEWLFAPKDAGDLARVLERRLYDPTTNYGSVISWKDAALSVEEILMEVCERNCE